VKIVMLVFIAVSPDDLAVLVHFLD
jgi:hypothetical protein